jgi:hypothetical protein
MERTKVGSIVGETKSNIPKIKKIIDSAKKEIKKSDELEKIEKKFEKILRGEISNFDIKAFSSDALCEVPLLTLFEMDEGGNLYLENNNIFKVSRISILSEMVACFNMEFIPE